MGVLQRLREKECKALASAVHGLPLPALIAPSWAGALARSPGRSQDSRPSLSLQTVTSREAQSYAKSNKKGMLNLTNRTLKQIQFISLGCVFTAFSLHPIQAHSCLKLGIVTLSVSQGWTCVPTILRSLSLLWPFSKACITTAYVPARMKLSGEGWGRAAKRI